MIWLEILYIIVYDWGYVAFNLNRIINYIKSY